MQGPIPDLNQMKDEFGQRYQFEKKRKEAEYAYAQAQKAQRLQQRMSSLNHVMLSSSHNATLNKKIDDYIAIKGNNTGFFTSLNPDLIETEMISYIQNVFEDEPISMDLQYKMEFEYPIPEPDSLPVMDNLETKDEELKQYLSILTNSKKKSEELE